MADPGSFKVREDQEWDASAKAEAVLDRVLTDTSTETILRKESEGAVAAELRKQRLLEAESTRAKSRVLFVTSDVSVCEKESAAALRFTALADVFDEVHVLVIGRRGTLKAQDEAIRLGPATWVYPLVPYFFVQTPFAARALARDELEFADGFRPDLVVALDPFESGVAGLFIADHYDRPFQVHLDSEDWLNIDKFRKEAKENTWRLRFLHYTLRRTTSVRVATESLKQTIAKYYKHIDDLALLPRFYHTRELLSLPRETSVDRFPQFVFTILTESDLDASSTVYRVLDAARMALQTPSIGLAVLGDGPLKEQFRQRAALLKIDRQVMFVGKQTDDIDYLRSADVLVVTDTTTKSDDLIIRAAALGVPIIMAKTPLRNDLFKDGTDAFLCDPEDTLAFTTKLRTFINTNALRTQFSENGREVIKTRIEEDPVLYRIAYRDSIEQLLFSAAEREAKATVSAAVERVGKTVAAQQPVVVNGHEMKVPEGMLDVEES